MNSHPRLDAARAALWTLMGAAVLLGVFFFAFGGVSPGEAQVFLIIIVVMAVLWAIHFWRVRSVATDIRLHREDRERRGF